MVSNAIKARNPKPKGLHMLKLVYPTCLKTKVFTFLFQTAKLSRTLVSL